MTELMTLKEVADYLRVTEKMVYRLLGRGVITAIKVGHQWRFAMASIVEWLQRKSVGEKGTGFGYYLGNRKCEVTQDGAGT